MRRPVAEHIGNPKEASHALGCAVKVDKHIAMITVAARQGRERTLANVGIAIRRWQHLHRAVHHCQLVINLPSLLRFCNWEQVDIFGSNSEIATPGVLV